MPKLVNIDLDKLREVMTANPTASSNRIAELLGVKAVTFDKKRKNDPDVRAIWNELKGIDDEKVSARKPRGASKRAQKAAAPPGNGHAKQRVSDELLRKIKHEFEHIRIYEQVTEFFGDLAEKVAAIK